MPLFVVIGKQASTWAGLPELFYKSVHQVK
jgi:hypothetical protein